MSFLKISDTINIGTWNVQANVGDLNGQSNIRKNEQLQLGGSQNK